MERQEWRKSSRSAGGTIHECVEVARRIGASRTLIRDSKREGGAQLITSPAGFDALLGMLRRDY